MQDRTGIQQHSKPTGARVESWKQLLQSPTQVHYAQNYLDALGPETFMRLGYPYAELQAAIGEAAARTRGRIELPWRLALMHPGEPKGMDQLRITSYRNIRDYGLVQGRLRTFGAFFTSLLVQLRWVFGRA
jgi:hypothetical protein